MKIFAITKRKATKRIPIQVFLEKNYTMAKLYFKGYIFNEKNPEDFQLYQTAEFDENFKLKENKIFITGGYELINKCKAEGKLINQIKFEFEENKKLEEEAKKQEETSKILKTLFKGKEIEI